MKVTSGIKALELIRAGRTFDLIITDIMMPEMDGYETIQQIRKERSYKDTPVIALTAKAMKEDRDLCIQAGASDYLAKPVDRDKLFSMLKIWLNRAPS